METEGKTNHCVRALPFRPGASPLYDPKAFTPIELKRMLLCQIRNRQEVHILYQIDGGTLEDVYEFNKAHLPGRDAAISARATEELIEVSDGFYFQTPAE